MKFIVSAVVFLLAAPASAFITGDPNDRVHSRGAYTDQRGCCIDRGSHDANFRYRYVPGSSKRAPAISGDPGGHNPGVAGWR